MTAVDPAFEARVRAGVASSAKPAVGLDADTVQTAEGPRSRLNVCVSGFDGDMMEDLIERVAMRVMMKLTEAAASQVEVETEPEARVETHVGGPGQLVRNPITFEWEQA